MWGDIVKGAHRRKDGGVETEFDEDESSEESSVEEGDFEEASPLGSHKRSPDHLLDRKHSRRQAVEAHLQAKVPE